MGKQTSHIHPNISLYKTQQIGLTILLFAAIFAAFMLIVMAIMLSAPLFVIMSVILLMLSSPLLMAVVNTPPVTVSDEGVLLERFIGGKHLIVWDDIERIEPYPLLPQANQEILKQYLIGRNKYRAAEGIMLIVPSLPLPYRIAGLLAETGKMPIITLTNRTHSDYETLKHRIMNNAHHAVTKELLTIEE